MSDLCFDNATSLTLRRYINECPVGHIIYTQVTYLYTSEVSETSHYLSTGHSFIYILSVRDVALSKNRSLIYIRPNCQRRRIISVLR
jgi:hypothetical protein